MNEQGVVVKVIADRTLGGSIEPDVSSFPPGLTLTFNSGGQDDLGRPAGATLYAIAGLRLQQRGIEERTSIPIALNWPRLAGQVSKCTKKWWEEVVEAQDLRGASMFFTYHVWTKVERNGAFASRVACLARAGQNLFRELFCPDDQGYERTDKFGCALRVALLAEHGLRIVIRSNEFFAPWNLLHLGLRHSPHPEEDFLGARHVVEQDVSDPPLDTDAMPSPDTVAVHFDRNMDAVEPTRKHRAVADFEHLLRQYGLKRVDRNTKSALLDALSAGVVEESLLYFMCHGTAGSDVHSNADDTHLLLTAEAGEKYDAISPADLGTSLKEGGPLKRRPLVFLNACRSLKSGSIYYTGFAPRFLNKGASAVIGPEVEMPILFAREFARRYFEEFFRGGKDRSIGRVLLALRREYLLEHANPLGLTYSLYRGANHYLPVEVPLQEPEA